MYFQHLSCLETLLEVSSNSPLGEAHNEESFALVQACDAVMSGFHKPPVSVTARKQAQNGLALPLLLVLNSNEKSPFT